MNRRPHRHQATEDSQVACCAVLCCVVQTVEIKLLHLTLATSPAGSLIVILTPATNNTFSTTDAGEATEETNTAVPVLPEPFQPVKSCVCAGVKM